MAPLLPKGSKSNSGTSMFGVFEATCHSGCWKAMLWLSTPWHDRHRGNAVRWRAFDQLATDGQIDESSVVGIPHPQYSRFLEQDGGVFREDGFLLRQLRRYGDGSRLPARQRKLRRILSQPKRPGYPAGSGLADVTSHARYLGIMEGFHTDLVVRPDQFPSGCCAADSFGLGQPWRSQQECSGEKVGRFNHDFHLGECCCSAFLVSAGWRDRRVPERVSIAGSHPTACVSGFQRCPAQQLRQPANDPVGLPVGEVRRIGQQTVMAADKNFLLREVLPECYGLRVLNQ